MKLIKEYDEIIWEIGNKPKKRFKVFSYYPTFHNDPYLTWLDFLRKTDGKFLADFDSLSGAFLFQSLLCDEGLLEVCGKESFRIRLDINPYTETDKVKKLSMVIERMREYDYATTYFITSRTYIIR